MSAFIVNKNHIAAMLNAGLNRVSWYTRDTANIPNYQDYHRQLTEETADIVGQMLLDENIKAVGIRYDDCHLTELPGDSEYLIPYKHKYMLNPPTPAQALKLIDCYEYQTCEDPGYYNTEASRFCNALRHHLITELPGYDNAPWEWKEKIDGGIKRW